MVKKRVICSAMAILLLFGGLFTPAAADIYWESEQIIKGRPDGLSKKKTIRNYVTNTCSRMDIGENVMIADFKTMTGYVLNTADKMYLEMRMDNVGKIPEDLKKEIGVTPTNETRKIAGYQCKKYKVRKMSREYDQWLSKDVDGYDELKSLSDKLALVMRQNPLFQMGIVGRMDKLDGFPVRTVMPMGNGTTKVITLKKVSRTPLDKKVFKVPKGYKPPY